MARVLVVGAGALGSVFGAFLRRAGDEVTLLGRPAHLEAIAAHGLRVDGLWGEHRIGGLRLATDWPRDDGRYDAVLVTVKSFDTVSVASQVGARLAADGVVLSLQNGLGNVEALADATGPDRVLGGRVIFGATLLAPGHVRVTVYAEPVLIGTVRHGEAALEHRAAAWAAHVADAGIPCEYCADVLAALWGKVLYNAALNPLGALLGVHYGALPEHAHTRAIMDAVIGEAFAVAQAEGISLPWTTAAAYREVFYARLVPSTAGHRSSMLQDLERGRRTEVDAINGAVWQRALSRGMVAPFNELLTRLVHAREALGPGVGVGR